MTELDMIRAFARLPRNIQRAASRLAADMAEQTERDETQAVLEVLVGGEQGAGERRAA